MIRTLYNTNVATAAGMIEVNDTQIRAWSSGAVSHVYDLEESTENLRGSLADPEIFGQIHDETLRMGHIELCMPVANIQYVRGRKPMMAQRLQMPLRDIERIVHSLT